MVLGVQVISLVVSFVYGIFFYLTLELNSRFIYSSHLWVRLVMSFLFVMMHTLVYFLILMRINHGYVHIYFFICILAGYLLCKVIYKRCKIKYKRFVKKGEM